MLGMQNLEVSWGEKGTTHRVTVHLKRAKVSILSHGCGS